ncbi:MAG: hypothetical protein J5772_08900 [Clostridia bacterium]|nr:hypothetical protein [Clostridia bacterium]
MNYRRIGKLFLGASALVLAAVFAVKLSSGSSPITSGLWLGAALILGILALSLSPDDEKARNSAVGSGIVLVLSLMILSFSAGRALPSSPQSYDAVAPTEANIEATEFVMPEPTAVPTETPVPTDTLVPTDTPEPTPTPIPTPTPTPTPTPAPVWYSAGMYKVGQDLSAGEYFLKATGSFAAYFAIHKDSSGTIDSIIANGNIETFCYVTLIDGEYFDVERGMFIEIEYAPENIIDEEDYESGIAGEGMYKIGRDLPAGEYKVVCNSGFSAYVEVSKDSRHRMSSIVSNDNFTNTKYITVKKGQYLTINRGYIVLK